MSEPLNFFTEPHVFKKISSFRNMVSFEKVQNLEVPFEPARNVPVLLPSQHPSKKGLSFLEGKQRLLHDLASIEIQAMELGGRTLVEFQGQPGIPEDFFIGLFKISQEEAEHALLCLNALKEYGGHWGQFPVHIGLWKVALPEDSLLERVLKVHRYLEGSGLDAGHTLLKRAKGVPESELLIQVLERVAFDEISHVKFGSKWFAYFCEHQGVSRVEECKRILKKAKSLLPRRREPIQEDLRLKAGFTPLEVAVFQEYQLK